MGQGLNQPLFLLGRGQVVETCVPQSKSYMLAPDCPAHCCLLTPQADENHSAGRAEAP